MEDTARRLLIQLGAEVPEYDSLLEYLCESVRREVCNEINQPALPEALRYAAAEMAAGRWLQFQKGAGRLDGWELDEAAVKELREGDTTVSYALGAGSCTPEQRLDALIGRLTEGRSGELLRFRRLSW